MSQRDKIAQIAAKYVGKGINSEEHKEIINAFNKLNPDGYKMSYTDYHCAATVSAIAYMAGLEKLIPCSCNCGTMLNKAKKMGIFIENDAYVPKAGDIIFYDWQDSGKGDNTGGPDHVGFVVSIKNKSITIFEGNMGNKRLYGYRTMKVDGQYIRGYAAPKYDDSAKTSEKKETTKTTEQPASTKINRKYKVIEKAGMNVRSGPSTKYKRVNGVAYGKTFTATKKSGNWVYSKYYGGWICIKAGTEVYLKHIKDEPWN